MENQNNENLEEPKVTEPIADVDDDFIFEYDEISISDIKKRDDVRILPSATRKELEEFSKDLDRDNFVKEKTDIKQTVSFALESEDYINSGDVGARELNSSLTNEPEFEGTPLKYKTLNIKKRVKSSKAALMKISQKAGIGSNIHIPLHHSGFWITYAPLTDEEIINLELEIINELARVGKETTSLVFSNYSVIFADVLLNQFSDKIVESTLKLDDDEDIFDYININDIYTIALYMARSMYPNGFQAVIPCSNVTKLTDDKVSKCSYKANVKVDLGELLWVDESKLTLEHRKQMSIKTPRSLTTDDVFKYQETLPTAGEVTLKFDDEDGDDITIILGPVSVSRYLDSGHDFIDDLRDKAIELIKKNKQLQDPDKAERVILKGIYLNVYNHFIKGLPVDDAVISDPAEVRDALTMLTSNHTLAKKIMDAIKEYINNSLISIVGIPNFSCPSCKQDQTTKEIVPLAVYEYLFILLHSRYTKILNKM
jgi:hypothetical protein